MGKFVINGGARLSGKIKAERAKNAVLPILAATLLTKSEVVIKDCPDIADVKNMLAVLSSVGAKHAFLDGNLYIKCENVVSTSVPDNLSKELRSSVLVAGGLLARAGCAEIAFPGGCDIGKRPIDIHISALKSLGATCETTESGVRFGRSKLKGGVVNLELPSVGATENVMIAAAAADGETTINNAAREPEIIDLAKFINAVGGKVFGAGSATIRIIGVKNFHGTEYLPMFDRIETGTYLIAAAITGGEIEISGVKSENISSLIGKLCDNTCKFAIKNDIIYMRGGKRRKPLFLSTGYYPDFPTDMQAQTTALAAVSCGTSVIEERVFENRFGFAEELIKMGADISVCGGTAIIKGIKRFSGATVRAADLRGGAALVLAGLNADGTTIINDSRHIERGYAKIEEKLRSLGADVIKID